jgi:predicted Zn finger-like uncharacterized protein
MSLATRCTSCGTIFRVVQDQLKVSDGWVRCGRCNEVFNAMEGLFDLQRETPARSRPEASTGPSAGAAAAPAAAAGSTREAPPRPAPSQPPPPPPAPRPVPAPPVATMSAVASARARATAAVPTATAAVAEDDLGAGSTSMAQAVHEVAAQELAGIAKGPAAAKSAAAGPAAAAPPPPRPAPAAAPARPNPLRRPREEWRDAEDENVSILPADDLRPAFADAKFPEESVQGDSPAETRPATEPAQLESQTTRSTAPSRSSSSRSSKSRSRSSRSSRSRRSSRNEPALPGFVQKAAQEERWRRPWVRVALALVVLAQSALLAGQMAYQWRDRLAAQYPQARPWLAAGCARLGCQLQAPQLINAIVVESTTLAKLDGIPEGYRLTVVLRNSAPHEVRQPFLDLSLTDGDGVVVARRALAPSEFPNRGGALPAQTETALQLALAIEGHRVAGYTVAAFYP